MPSYNYFHVLWFPLCLFQNIVEINKDGDRPCLELDIFRDPDTHVEGRIIQAGHPIAGNAVSLQNCGTW